jgi:hypothetical protein
MRFTKTPFLIAAALLVFGVAMRLLPHPANVTPLTAIALFAGVYFRGKWIVLVPVLTMVASDLLIGWHNLVLFTWGSFAAMVLMGLWAGRKLSVGRLLLGSLAGSTLFFLVTNWAVWAFTPMYEKSAAGLLASYTMALPFFRNMAAGDLFYVGAFFGVMELARALAKRRIRART